MDRRVTSPIWGPPLPCKQALNFLSVSKTSRIQGMYKAWYEIRSQAKRRGPGKAVAGHFKTSITSSVTLPATNVTV